MARTYRLVKEVRHGEVVKYHYKLVTLRRKANCRRCHTQIEKGLPAWSYDNRRVHRNCLDSYEQSYASLVRMIEQRAA